MRLVPTFGERIKGLRWGFGWAAGHGCYLRLSRTESENVFRGEVRPAGGLEKGTGDIHMRWWPDGGGFGGLDINEIALVRGLKRVKRAFVFYFNDEGVTL